MLNGTTLMIFLETGSLHFKRSLIKDNARFYDNGKARKEGKERGRKELSLLRDTNPRPHDHQVIAQPLTLPFSRIKEFSE